jgi:DnaK suppressor protein
MDAKKIEAARRRLSSEYENLIKSINRSRLAAETIKLENTEDEGDLETISHEREFLYDLHESDFARLKFIQEAIKAMDRGQYGECVRCGEHINEKRLEAVAMGHDVHPLPGRDGDGAHFFTYGAGPVWKHNRWSCRQR